MAESLNGQKVSTTYQTILHTSEQIGSEIVPVYDGIGHITSLSIGPSATGILVDGSITATGSLTADSIELNGSKVNKVSFATTDSSDSNPDLVAQHYVSVGRLRVVGDMFIEDYLDSNKEVLFGSNGVKISLDEDRNKLSIYHSQSDTAPFILDINTGEITIKSLNIQSSSQSCPVGMIADFPSLTIPVGWVECDGSKYTMAALSSLGTLLSSTYGGYWDGTGELSAFNVPDYRGVYRRTIDHATVGGGAATGRDPQSGRLIGSYQTDDFKSHIHNISVATTNITALPPGSTPALVGTGTTTLSATGGSETRVKNIAVVTCIKS